MISIRRMAIVSATAATLALGLPMATAAAADFEARGDCTAASDWRLEVDSDNGQLEIRYRVTSGIAGQTWQYRIADNGTVLSQGTRQTASTSGQFEVRINAANLAGPDRIVGQARNQATGEICQGRVTLP